MPRQLQDRYSHVRPLTTVTPITRGGTGADNKTQAVINLQGINRNRIDQPLGIAGCDHQGYMHRKYLENAGIFSGITLEGPTTLARSGPGMTYRPLFFISNYHTPTPPEVTSPNPTVQDSLEVNGQYITFDTPSVGDNVTLRINDRDYVIPLIDDTFEKPVILTEQNNHHKQAFVLNASKCKTIGTLNVNPSSDWITIMPGITELIYDTPHHSLLVQSWSGEDGSLFVYDGDDNVAFPKSLMRYTVSPLTARRIRLYAENVQHASYLFLRNTLLHTATDWQVSSTPDFTMLVLNVVGETNSLNSLAASLDNGEYYVRVRYKNGVIMSPWSDAVKFIVDSNLNSLNETGLLSNPDMKDAGMFGASLSLSKGLLAVGASQNTFYLRQAGSVFLFRQDGFSHIYEDRINSPRDVDGELFGASVCLTEDGDLFVGAPGYDGKGAVYHYLLVENEFIFQRVFMYHDNSNGFGYAVHATKNKLFIGDPLDSTNGNNAGCIHVYHREPDGYTYRGRLFPTTSSSEDNFGVSITSTADEGFLFTGASSPSLVSETFGKVYVFKLAEDNTYEESVVRDSPIPVIGARFARSLAYVENTKKLYVGCEADSERGTAAGAVFVFNCIITDNITLQYQSKLMAENGVTHGYFGSALAASQDGYYLYVGSRGYRFPTSIPGSVYFLA